MFKWLRRKKVELAPESTRLRGPETQPENDMEVFAGFSSHAPTPDDVYEARKYQQQLHERTQMAPTYKGFGKPTPREAERVPGVDELRDKVQINPPQPSWPQMPPELGI